ncbi:LytR/AlgR family response regulator transcription factor [Flavivirga eckloniae]|uniref:HTH LytTR-type domain-containing protein n=1 Tax=Flavivirga eckloniae TaxID=1803846 RepID=A0A2K9PTJ3_9FLAO|nr:LytTR family DNA-binding domain-containing protein [Flavivirga eckloniae]AUP80386.1 hypothetical protein C1H87_17385 [Flavivirga eckloniae]
MKIKSSNLYYHILYWIFVIVVLTLAFGRSWDNKIAAFFFVSMLLPIVLGTSYFFNYFLVPRLLFKKQILKLSLYTIYTLIISLYLESIVLMFSFVYFGNFSFQNLGPNASDTILLAAVLYLLVFIGAFILMLLQARENNKVIEYLSSENGKLKISFLEILSNRKIVKVSYKDIIYIESLSDHIRINTNNEQIKSKEKISNLMSRLPDVFLRIHRSFIINTEKIKEISYDRVLVGRFRLNIGRSYRKEVKEALKTIR